MHDGFHKTLHGSQPRSTLAPTRAETVARAVREKRARRLALEDQARRHRLIAALSGLFRLAPPRPARPKDADAR